MVELARVIDMSSKVGMGKPTQGHTHEHIYVARVIANHMQWLVTPCRVIVCVCVEGQGQGVGCERCYYKSNRQKDNSIINMNKRNYIYIAQSCLKTVHRQKL